ncbi:thioredoxin-like protein [Tirmania nivea]|nr:thioredoxin-like protein [Tirmania nivea]
MALRVRCSMLRVFATPRFTTNSTCSSLKPSSALLPSCVTIFNQHRSIQNLATPTTAKPTEKIVYGVEEDPDDLLTKEAQEALSAVTEGNRTSYPTVSYAGSVTTIHCSSESQRQAVFVDRTISSNSSTTSVHRPEEQIAIVAMGRRSKSESPQGAWQKAQDKQFPQLKLNHLAPNFHALSSHGPIELYEYLSTPLKSFNRDPAMKATVNATDQDAKEGNWVVFFSHPMDFTPGCTTEIASIANLQDEFAKRRAKLLGLSIGSVEQYRNWMKEIRKIIDAGGTGRGGPLGAAKAAAVGQSGAAQPVSGGGHGDFASAGAPVSAGGLGALDEEKEMGMEDVVGSGSIRVGTTEKRAELTPEGGGERSLLNFPIIADEDAFVSQLYGMLEDAPEATEVDPSTGERRSDNLRPVRSLFIIDPNRRIRLMTAYPNAVGGITAEILRVLDALQRNAETGVLTPEGRAVGDEVAIPPHEDGEKKFGKGG